MKYKNHLLVLLVILTLVGCGGSAKKDTPKDKKPDEKTNVDGPM